MLQEAFKDDAQSFISKGNGMAVKVTHLQEGNNQLVINTSDMSQTLY